MNDTRNGLLPAVHHDAIATLNGTVARLFELFVCVKQADWNAGGAVNIRGTSVRLDEFAVEIMGQIDRAIQRAAALGGAPDDAQLLPFQEKNHFDPPFDDSPDLVRELAERHASASEYVRLAVKQRSVARDFGSADLLADILRTLDTHRWLLEMYLYHHQPKSGTGLCSTLLQ